MWERGKLFVFEGPDGVGKSTLCQALAAHLENVGVPVKHLSFPGRDAGTLGKLVYTLHHEAQSLGVDAVSPASRQALHIAAHLDAIERIILPALQSGYCVILDRFWWSTWVYGIVDGVSPAVLRALLRVEEAQWGEVRPALAFLVCRDNSFRTDEPTRKWHDLAAAYGELAQEENGKYPIQSITNDRPIKDMLSEILARIEKEKQKSIQDSFPSSPQSVKSPDVAAKRKTSIAAKRASLSQTPRTTEVFDTYWRFAAERQAIFFRRLRGGNEPWTQDPILQRHKFTNAYRASDRVSQYLIRHVIYPDPQQAPPCDPDDLFFRIMLFKVLNRIAPWQQLERELGRVSHAEYSFENYDQILRNMKARGECIFSSAYIMPTGVSVFGYSEKHRNYLKLIERMIEDGVPWRLSELKTMRQAFELLRSYPLMGDFLAYQYVTDLNYSPLTNFSESEFVMPGPGARDGIAKCFLDTGGLSEADVIRWVADRQQQEFERLNLSFADLWGRSLQLIDCQNLFCEVDKYARIAHPDVKGLSGRTRIKQKFQPETDAIAYWYPPKWGINERILEDVEQSQRAGHSTMTLPFDEG
jgi:thymidylate kinase